MNDQAPARAHIPAKDDYRVDQIRRYMRRHAGIATFVNAPAEELLCLDDLPGLHRSEIRDWFNAARREGHNQ